MRDGDKKSSNVSATPDAVIRAALQRIREEEQDAEVGRQVVVTSRLFDYQLLVSDVARTCSQTRRVAQTAIRIMTRSIPLVTCLVSTCRTARYQTGL